MARTSILARYAPPPAHRSDRRWHRAVVLVGWASDPQSDRDTIDHRELAERWHRLTLLWGRWRLASTSTRFPDSVRRRAYLRPAFTEWLDEHKAAIDIEGCAEKLTPNAVRAILYRLERAGDVFTENLSDDAFERELDRKLAAIKTPEEP